MRLQEELDWLSYELYGVLPAGSPAAGRPPDMAQSGLDASARPYRYAARAEEAAGDPVDLQRLELLRADANIGLIERPEYKRRWFRPAGAYDDAPLTDEMLQDQALRSWLLDRLESPAHWPEVEHQTCARLADRAADDTNFMEVASLYRGRADFDVAGLVSELVESEAVPFLPILRYKDGGLRNRALWERSWELQRKEDAIDARMGLPEGHSARLTSEAANLLKARDVGEIPVPPKYTSADFLKSDFWRLRGKLDVPKERFVSYPHCERDADPTLLVGWAGWDHLQQAQAVASYYLAMKETEGWARERLTPLLAGLLELQPWLDQWHNSFDAAYGMSMADHFRDFVDAEARELGLTLDQVRGWQPQHRPRSGRKRKDG